MASKQWNQTNWILEKNRLTDYKSGKKDEGRNNIYGNISKTSKGFVMSKHKKK